MRVKSVSFSFLTTMLCFGMLAEPAYAYLDPGTGSMILQILLGGIAGAALAGRFYWNRFLVLIGMRSERTADGPGEEGPGEASKSQADR